MFFYCKRCRTAVAAVTPSKVRRFRSGHVARYLTCGHTANVNDAPVRLMDDDSPITPAEIAGLCRAALTQTKNDPQRARAMVEAYLAGLNQAIPV